MLFQIVFTLKYQVCMRVSDTHNFSLKCWEYGCYGTGSRHSLPLKCSVQHIGLWVKEIDYTSQEMFVRYPDDEYCLQRRIVNLNLSALPFQFTDSMSVSFFNCSEKKSESYGFWGSIPSTCSSSDPVYFTRSPNYLSEVDLTSCRKIFNATIP